MIALPAPAILRTPKGLEHVGPRAFGHDTDYVSVLRVGGAGGMRRIGIDVGGTNTDAVLIEGNRVLAAVKTTTTADVLGGIRTALDAVAGRDGAIQAASTRW